MYVEDCQRDWDQHLPLLMLAYRSAVHESTRCSPSQLMMGRELRLPVDLLYGRPEEEDRRTPYAEALQNRLDQVHEYARTRLQMSSDRMKRYYDAGTSKQSFEAGDPVWLFNPRRRKGLTPKLQRPWEGPYTILKRINDLVYRVQLTARSKAKVVHVERLWRYRGDNPPQWFDPTTTLSEGEANLPTTVIDYRKDDSAPPDDEHVEPEQERESPASPQVTNLRRSQRSRRPPARYGLDREGTRDVSHREGDSVTEETDI